MVNILLTVKKLPMFIKYPKVKINKESKVYVSFYVKDKRYRIANGKRIGSITNPNSYPIEERLKVGKILAAEVYSHLNNGGVLKSYRSEEVVYGRLRDIDYIEMALNTKLKGNYSRKYKANLSSIYTKLSTIIGGDKLSKESVKSMLDHYTSNTSYNTVRRHLNALLNEAVNQGLEENPLIYFKSRKAKAKLNKPFKDTAKTLDEIKTFNEKLYLCCLMTFGCLLRPHREIRELKWEDFSEDLSHINLSGNRNKSGRNRIVPVPKYVRDILVKGNPCDNIFSGNPKPLNEDYFKTLWSRFKAQSETLEQGQTLYSFRHTGAIEIFKRTGSITKLQKAMGHSSINVSLTYLRGLEVAELTEEDMPRV